MSTSCYTLHIVKWTSSNSSNLTQKIK